MMSRGHFGLGLVKSVVSFVAAIHRFFFDSLPFFSFRFVSFLFFSFLFFSSLFFSSLYFYAFLFS